ncbi:MAG: CAP domain-containing protein [Chloroflexi bacterium]|nr:CAP domain-containing protein [Chloroflexota bacterium]
MIVKLCRLLCLLCFAAWLIPSPPPQAHAQDEVYWLLEQINSLRASLGLPGYSLNPQLSAAAIQHSQYMAAGCDVTHTENNGSTPASRAAANGYSGTNVSENIYAGSIARATDAWQFWIHSPVHYAGLTHGYVNEVGIGIAGGLCQSYTLLFGHRDDVNAPPAPAAVPAPSGANTGDAAAPAPTQRPYVPPPPTHTPTPTILTLTPSVTWTITPSYTPSLTHTPPSPSATPLILPTVAAQEVALVASPTDTPSPTLSPSPWPTEPPPSLTPVPTLRPIPASSREGDFEPRDLVPFALAGQIILIGLAGFIYFRRAR